MVGMSVIGGALQTDPDAGTLMAFILLGKYDHELKCAHYFQHYGKEPANDAELEDPTVVVMLDRTKRFFRSIVQGIFDEAARQDQLEQEEKRKALLQQLRESNKPHEMGTVAEIAAKYGISKSEVRRRKAEGTLHELQKTSA